MRVDVVRSGHRTGVAQNLGGLVDSVDRDPLRRAGAVGLLAQIREGRTGAAPGPEVLGRDMDAGQLPGTIVFATVAGEEEGLYGSSFMAQQMKSAGDDVQGMFSNDIIGASQGFDGTKPDPFTVRMSWRVSRPM